MTRKSLTSLDLARLAGVSSATVSRAFTAGSLIRPETRARILALADAHGFRPNAMARTLNNSASRLVALVVNTVANPAEAEGLDALIALLQESERLPLVLRCAGHADRSALMRLAATYQVDQVVLFSDAVSIDDAMTIFGSTVPVVASSEPLAGRAVSDVRLDASAAAAEIIDHLVAVGRRHFAYLSGRAASHVDKQRRASFSRALDNHGLVFRTIAQGDYSYASGYRAGVDLLARQDCDAVVCANDLMAIGLQDAAAARGIAVPRDMAIVGHDGVGITQWESHSLTTIAPPRGSVAAALFDIIDRPAGAAPDQRVIACSVVWGRSTGP